MTKQVSSKAVEQLVAKRRKPTMPLPDHLLIADEKRIMAARALTKLVRGQLPITEEDATKIDAALTAMHEVVIEAMKLHEVVLELHSK